MKVTKPEEDATWTWAFRVSVGMGRLFQAGQLVFLEVFSGVMV